MCVEEPRQGETFGFKYCTPCLSAANHAVPLRQSYRHTALAVSHTQCLAGDSCSPCVLALQLILPTHSVTRQHLNQVQCGRCSVLCRSRADFRRGHSRCWCARCCDCMQLRPRNLHVSLLGCDWSSSAITFRLSPVVSQEYTALPLAS